MGSAPARRAGGRGAAQAVEASKFYVDILPFSIKKKIIAGLTPNFF
jgi:hypothetical protein